MPRYFFHLRRLDGELEPDRSGSRLPDDEEAFRSALQLARGLPRSAAGISALAEVEIHDEGGWHVETVPVRPTQGVDRPRRRALTAD